jgi:hypothetical protein
MRVSLKVKAFCYVCVNIGVVGWSIILLLEKTPAQRALLTFLISLVMMNLLLWLLFRMKDKGSL